MDADAVTMGWNGWNVRFVCFADTDNDVGGGGDAAYVDTCQYSSICVYMMAYNAYVYIYVYYIRWYVRMRKKNIILQQTLFGLDAYRPNANGLE